MRIKTLGAVLLLGSVWASPAMSQTGQAYYPAFCQGMSIDNGENHMFVSGTFLYPQSAVPTDGVLREGSAGSEFTREVQRRSGKTLLDSVCHTRPTADEITELSQSTVRSNGAGWKVETFDWRPRGARVLTAPQNLADNPVQPEADPLGIGVPAAAATRNEEAARKSAASEAAAARIAAEEQANAERLRDANAKALAAAAEQTRRIEAEKQAAAARLARFEAEQKAYEKAKAEYVAGVAAAEAARRKWEADVAACRAGDLARCGTAQ